MPGRNWNERSYQYIPIPGPIWDGPLKAAAKRERVSRNRLVRLIVLEWVKTRYYVDPMPEFNPKLNPLMKDPSDPREPLRAEARRQASVAVERPSVASDPDAIIARYLETGQLLGHGDRK